MTKTVTSNTQVLTAGENVDQEKSREGRPISVTAVTLLVTPVDAERITLAQSQGELMLALRNPMDTDTTQTNGAVVNDLFGAPRPAASRPTPSPGPSECGRGWRRRRRLRHLRSSLTWSNRSRAAERRPRSSKR